MSETDEPRQETAEVPEVLYKYRDWVSEYSKRSIEHLEVFFPSPRRFNDPFDCAIPIEPFAITEENLRAFAEGIVDRDIPDLDSAERQLEIDRLLLQFRKNSENQTAREEWRRSLKAAGGNDFGILSLTADPTSVLMWSYYADKHAGFCVGYDTRILFETVVGLRTACRIMPVQYERYYPDLTLRDAHTNLAVFEAMLTTKAIDWAHEQEFRLILIETNEMALALPESAIVEVIVGARMPQNHVEEIAGILERHSLSSVLRRARLAEDKYAISIERFPSE